MIVSTRLTRGGRTAREVTALVSGQNPEQFAKHHFADSPEVAVRVKSAISALATTDGAWGTARDVEFLNLLAAEVVPLRFGVSGVPSLRTVPFLVPVAAQVEAAFAAWVGQGKAKPVTKYSYGDEKLEPLTIAVLIVMPEELARLRGAAGETSVTRALIGGVSAGVNTEFIDPAVAAVAGESPGSITNGVTPIPSTLNVTTDFLALIAAATLDLADAVLILSPVNAVAIAAQLGAAAAGLGVRGGVLFGLPVITSAAAGNNLILAHAGSILFADGGDIRIDTSISAALEMDNAPTQSSSAPTGATNLVSMFQTDSIAIRVERQMNWKRTHPDAVVMVSDADYAGVGS